MNSGRNLHEPTGTMLGGGGQQQQMLCGGTSTPTSSDATLSIVSSLLRYRLGDEKCEGFEKRAIESLVKKLKEKPTELDALISAIRHNGEIVTKCVTIQRTLDGRLQVAGRKGFPHVIYAKIWRWPDLTKSELKHLSHCEHPYEFKNDVVCVNPYHYERIVSPGIDITGLSLSSPVSVSSASSNLSSSSNYPLVGDCVEPLTIKTEQFNDSSLGGPIMQSSSSKMHQINSLSMNHISPPLHQQQQPSSSMSVFNSYNQLPHLNDVSRNININISNQNQMSQQAQHHQRGATLDQQQTFVSSLPPPEFWCSIQYYEHDEQVGEVFKVPYSFEKVIVDGFVDPQGGDRFCLGALSNVDRLPVSSKVRYHIGNGITLHRVGEGDVWLECKSDFAVFAESFYLDREAGRQPGDTIHKIYPQSLLKIFDLRQCHNQLKQQAHASIVISQMEGLPPPTSAPRSPAVSVDDLRRLCVLQISFVKGYGPNYTRRSIKETPCWIEIHLHRALQLLDEVLHSIPTAL